jgi:hypothetical protein
MNEMQAAPTPSDDEILHHRALLAAVLGSPELVAMRREIQALYADQADAARSAAQTARHLGARASMALPTRAALWQPEGVLVEIDAYRSGRTYEGALDEALDVCARAARDRDVSGRRIAETEEHAKVAFAAWARADKAYAVRRAERMAEAGVEEGIAGTPLAAERAQSEAFTARLLMLPPEGWGLKKYPDVETRKAAWQARPAFERRTCLDKRIAA